MKPQTPLKQRMLAGETLLGTFAFLPSPAVVEILGGAGLDFVIIDTEHSPKSPEVIESMVRAAQYTGMSALVRVADQRDSSILQALEMGAEGVVVPFVRTAAEGAEATWAAKYPPEGRRGTCTATRAAKYGALRGSFAEHAAWSNENVLVVAQLEDVVAAANVTEIAASPIGPDVLLIGRADLAASMGRPGLTHDPEVVATAEQMLDSVVAAAVPGRKAGVGVYSPDEAASLTSRGVPFLVYATDTLMVRATAADAVSKFRSTLAATGAAADT